MKSIKTLILWVLLCIAIPISSYAQEPEWTHETAKGGTKMKYHIGSRSTAGGDEQLVVRYEATKTVAVDLAKAATFLNNANNYEVFLEHVEGTKNVGKLASGGWYLYQFISPPWPMPDADCVQQVLVKHGNGELTVVLTAAPNAYAQQNVDRMDLSDFTFHFKKVDDTNVQLTISSLFAPIGSPPKFLMSTWFPNGPEGIIDRLVASINKL